jgi:hypothetical protein
MAYMLERDAVNGKEGRAVATINGKQIELFNLKNLNLECSLDKSDFKVVGTRVVQKKVTGIQFTGSMQIVYGSPHWKQMVKEYVLTGRLPYFNIQVTNNDPSVTIGTQTIVVYNCLIDGTKLAQLDSETDVMTEDVNFTYTHFEILEAFHEPETLGVSTTL